jgi:multidrug efflux pump subunit AcrB
VSLELREAAQHRQINLPWALSVFAQLSPSDRNVAPALPIASRVLSKSRVERATPNDVVAAVQSQNVQAALGRVGAAPIAKDQQFQITIKTKGRLTTPEEFGAIVVRANVDGSVVRVSDVARVEMGARTQDRYSRFNGAPAAALGIYQSPGSNAIDVARQIRNTMTNLATRFPSDVSYDVFFDSTVFVSATKVVRTLAIAIVLVALVVFVFLGRFRTTLIPLVAVPVSIIGTFAVMLLIGYSANTVSLLALVLAIGIVVDDAIVVVENIERVIEKEPDLSVPEACKKAMAEITGPIIAITFVLLSVFVPVAFIPGISGQLFRQFAVAVSVAMLISALNALQRSRAAVGVDALATPRSLSDLIREIGQTCKTSQTYLKFQDWPI